MYPQYGATGENTPFAKQCRKKIGTTGSRQPGRSLPTKWAHLLVWRHESKWAHNSMNNKPILRCDLNTGKNKPLFKSWIFQIFKSWTENRTTYSIIGHRSKTSLDCSGTFDINVFFGNKQNGVAFLPNIWRREAERSKHWKRCCEDYLQSLLQTLTPWPMRQTKKKC